MTQQPEVFNPIAAAESFIGRYLTFTSPDYAFVCALWTVATYLWPDFDCFPYLVITSATKRAGKTRLAEVMSFMCANARRETAATMGGVYQTIKEESPTLFFDEAEVLSSETASSLRAILNAGYRKGQFIRRWGKGGVTEWPTYCPKAFILIGDVFDTLRDRSIQIVMMRGEAPERFVYSAAESDGNAIGTKIRTLIEEGFGKVMVNDIYTRPHNTLPFLMDRDEEIWLPLFAVCEAFAPERVPELRRIAVDLATEKTQDARRYSALADAEEKARDDEYARRLLSDLAGLLDGKQFVYTADVIDALKAIETAPWRKYRGDGLTDKLMADLMSRFGLTPVLIKQRVGEKRRRGEGERKAIVKRGYKRADVLAALKHLG